MKKIKTKRKPRYILPELPVLADNGNKFKYNGNIYYSGSIIRRRQGRYNPLWHYGIVYGFDNNKSLWIIELTRRGFLVSRYVEFTSFRKYEIEISYYVNTQEESDYIINNIKNNLSNINSFNTISKQPFVNRNLNCESFVNYLVNSDLTSYQNKTFEIIGGIIINATDILNDLNIKNESINKSINSIRTSLNIKNIKY